MKRLPAGRRKHERVSGRKFLNNSGSQVFSSRTLLKKLSIPRTSAYSLFGSRHLSTQLFSTLSIYSKFGFANFL